MIHFSMQISPHASVLNRKKMARTPEINHGHKQVLCLITFASPGTDKLYLLCLEVHGSLMSRMKPVRVELVAFGSSEQLNRLGNWACCYLHHFDTVSKEEHVTICSAKINLLVIWEVLGTDGHTGWIHCISGAPNRFYVKACFFFLMLFMRFLLVYYSGIFSVYYSRK